MIILLNGPPRCGKDTAARFIHLALHNTGDYKMSRPLKAAVIKFFDLTLEQTKMSTNYPDMQYGWFQGLTYREAQIIQFRAYEEKLGKIYLAEMAVNYIRANMTNRHIVISDSGMSEESQFMVKAFGNNKVCLIQIKREGCNFDNDIREYVNISCMEQAWIDNKYDLELYESQVNKVLKGWGLIDGSN